MRPSPAALILDFDGLILDTETTDFESWRSVYEDHGVALPRDEWATAIGTDGKAFDPMARLAALTGRSLEEAALRAERRRRRDALVSALEPLPGVVEWLDAARREELPIAIASSSPRDWVEAHLRRVELLHYFSELVTSERAARVKPHPELYQEALRSLGVAPRQAIAVEDSANGVAAAKGAGLYCVAVPGPMTRHMSFEAADLVLPSLADRTLREVLDPALRGR
jgi:HAD superfamily hydrolase (TIGR01509 family)